MAERNLQEDLALTRIPVSTYRLQFNSQFTFSDARKVIPYLSKIGITDVYSSPYFKAKEGSLHGYDIVDYSQLNPEIGTFKEFEELSGELKRYEMGQMLDIVPNHMCIESKDNIWWMDVLENGPSSPYAAFFDIDWEPVKKELRNRILVPVLGDQYGNVLEKQELRLSFEEGKFMIYYYDKKFPIIPKTYCIILKHDISRLEERLSSDNPHFVELLNIISSLMHLPSYAEQDPQKKRERSEKKEVLKARLWNLYNASEEIRTFVHENVQIFNGKQGEPRSFDLLDELLDCQVYRLSYWRVATEEINYRRFFDINGLGAIRIENPTVFHETHRPVLDQIRQGKVTALRVDHPDGLYNPSEYFQQLQRHCFVHLRLGLFEKTAGNPLSYDQEVNLKAEINRQYEELTEKDDRWKPFYIVGEKILTKGERMPEEWPIYSTTGYVFMNSLNGLFVEARNAKIFDDIYSKFIREKIQFHSMVYENKKLILKVALSSEVNTLGQYLNKISEKNRHTRDFTLNSLTDAIKEVIAFFPVYRSYINSYEVNDRDQQYIELAVAKATRKNPALSESVFNFLRQVLLLRFPDDFDEDNKKEWLDFVMKFQQITGPAMAKGLEDTTFYAFNRFVSLNEVGGMPDRFGTSLETFHGQNIERMKFWPHALIASSTHDSKRSEDVRARINVLSEIPDEWKKRLILWSRLNKNKKIIVDNVNVPDRNEEYLLYQILIGAWPLKMVDKSSFDVFRNRIREYMLKAIREAKINTSWISPNIMYEEAVRLFIEKILDDSHANRFLDDFREFQRTVSGYGMLNSLSQTLLRITSPGVPDFYQGTELWDFSLVDPDNRRPVDYRARETIIEEIISREAATGPSGLSHELTAEKENSKIKLYLIYKSLNYRKAKKDIFEEGEYISIETAGRHAYHVCSFARRMGKQLVIVAVPRFLTKVIEHPDHLPFGDAVWGNTCLVIPFDSPNQRYVNIFTGETVATSDSGEATVIWLSEVFLNYPVALLEAQHS